MTSSISLVKITAIIGKINDALKMSKITLRQIQSSLARYHLFGKQFHQEELF